MILSWLSELAAYNFHIINLSPEFSLHGYNIAKSLVSFTFALNHSKYLTNLSSVLRLDHSYCSYCRKTCEGLGCNPIWDAVCSSRSGDQAPSTRLRRRRYENNYAQQSEPVIERQLGFHLVQEPSVHVDTHERLTPKFVDRRKNPLGTHNGKHCSCTSW